MIRWFIVIFLALILISWFSPWLTRLGFGRLPGDLRFFVMLYYGGSPVGLTLNLR